MMRSYTPRRASRKWLEGAPSYILDVFDSNGLLYRYTVCFTGLSAGTSFADGWVDYLGMDDSPTHPQGISMYGQMRAHEMAAYRDRCRRRQRIRWLDLPDNIRAHVIARAKS